MLVDAVFQAVARALQQRGYAKGGAPPQSGGQSAVTDFQGSSQRRDVAVAPACCV